MEIKASKDPDAVKDYSVDWSGYLTQVGESIVTSEYFIADDDETLVIEYSGHDGQKTLVALSGGVAKRKYRITNRITTDSVNFTRVEDRTFVVPVREM